MIPEADPGDAPQRTSSTQHEPRHNAGAVPRKYHSYLMRLWCDGAQQQWRAELHSALSRQVYRFAAVEDLFAFLQSQMAAEQQEPDSDAIDSG